MDKIQYSMRNLEAFCGRKIGVSPWVEIDQSAIDQFAACTRDHGWMHVDVDRVNKESPHRSTIAHSFLTLALLPQIQTDMGLFPPDARQVLNYGIENVRFLAPVPVNSKIRDHATIESIERHGNGEILMKTSNRIEIKHNGATALVAETLVLLCEVGRSRKSDLR